jgi:hypothetical protein
VAFDGSVNFIDIASADKMAGLVGLTKSGNHLETNGSGESEEVELSGCFYGSQGCGGGGDLTS